MTRRTYPVRCPVCRTWTYEAEGVCRWCADQVGPDPEDQQPEPSGRAPTGEWFE